MKQSTFPLKKHGLAVAGSCLGAFTLFVLMPYDAFAAAGVTPSSTSVFSSLQDFMDDEAGTLGKLFGTGALVFGLYKGVTASAVGPALPSLGIAGLAGFGPTFISGIISTVI